MGHGYKSGAGGGAGLNFKVIAYDTGEALLAAAPKKNTIGIITTTPITCWIFSATEPVEPSEGMVWFAVGTSSTVEFNALKKNAIQVYPLSAKQYIGGAWVAVAAMSYQNGTWTEWLSSSYLFYYGNQRYTWQARAWAMGTSYTAVVPTVVENSDGSVTISVTRDTSGMVAGVYEIAEDIELTNFNTLKVVASVADGSAYAAVVSRSAKTWHDDAVASINLSDSQEIDISGVTGAYDVVIGVRRNTYGTSDGLGTTSVKLESIVVE